MESRIDSCPKIKYCVYIKAAFLGELLPELFGYLACTLYGLLILNVQFFEFNYLSKVTLYVNYFVLFRQKLAYFGLKILYNPQT